MPVWEIRGEQRSWAMLRIDTDIGLALRRYRISANLNQAEIARSLGVSQSRVSRWESGREKPRARNLEMLKTLVWGRHDPLLDALVHQVRESMSPLVLVDGRLEIIAASRFLRLTGGPMSQFGAVLERRWNPGIGKLAQDFRACAQDGAIAARLVMPFSHDGEAWVCTARLTCCPIGPRLYGMGEMSFARNKSGEAVLPRIVAIRAEH
jgi:transcriptional regulator with XRE-family HTH domain